MDRRETCDYAVKDKPGLYKMVRSVMVGGTYHRNEMVVRNPAFGAQVFNAWEECLLAEAATPKTVARVSALRQARQRAA